MKTIFEWKSLADIDNQESISGADDCCQLFSMRGFLDRAPFGADLNLVATHHGTGFDRGRSSRQAKTLHSSRNLPDDSAAIEFVNDRIGDVAVVPATSKASAVEGSS